MKSWRLYINENNARNRYDDILPVPGSEVKLKLKVKAGRQVQLMKGGLPTDEKDDDFEYHYVNASRIVYPEFTLMSETYQPTPSGKSLRDRAKDRSASQVILTQGPLSGKEKGADLMGKDNTEAHFWQMVWDERTHAIFNLTSPKEAAANNAGKKNEKETEKCSEYWPQEPGTKKTFDDIGLGRSLTVQRLGVDELKDLLIVMATEIAENGLQRWRNAQGALGAVKIEDAVKNLLELVGAMHNPGALAGNQLSRTVQAKVAEIMRGFDDVFARAARQGQLKAGAWAAAGGAGGAGGAAPMDESMGAGGGGPGIFDAFGSSVSVGNAGLIGVRAMGHFAGGRGGAPRVLTKELTVARDIQLKQLLLILSNRFSGKMKAQFKMAAGPVVAMDSQELLNQAIHEMTTNRQPFLLLKLEPEAGSQQAVLDPHLNRMPKARLLAKCQDLLGRKCLNYNQLNGLYEHFKVQGLRGCAGRCALEGVRCGCAW